MVRVKVRAPTLPAESWICAVKLKFPVAIGEPVNTKLLAVAPDAGWLAFVSMAKPGGNEPTMLMVYGPVPPAGFREMRGWDPCWNMPRFGPEPNVNVAAVPETMLNPMKFLE